MRVAIVHDYLTQRGGAERVVLAMTRTFPSAPVYTALYEPGSTFPEFREVDVRTMWLDRLHPLRHRHRLALPLLAGAFEHTVVDADIVVCSSSGWAHGIQASAPKVVYCHTPARWLYDSRRYLNGRLALGWVALSPLRRYLRGWDRRSACSAERYLANSNVVRERIRETYGIDAQVLAAPPTLRTEDPQSPVEGLDPGFVLSVARLLPYKNVDAVVRAFEQLPPERLVVVGVGPEAARLQSLAPANVRFVGAVPDAQLRWLYANCALLVAASYEDFGLTPLEAAVFGKPAVTLRAGGFLDTVVEAETGLFFDRTEPSVIQDTLRQALTRGWDETVLHEHAETFSERRFSKRLREVVEEEAARC